ncbi:hypothetical protein HJFPF1_07615 [Paramyrothecium foliicola]|nr:hypothetical protein HJFPF1_07615 [Paramyrothecium foliicola]
MPQVSGDLPADRKTRNSTYKVLASAPADTLPDTLRVIWGVFSQARCPPEGQVEASTYRRSPIPVGGHGFSDSVPNYSA